jgi:hypothetical protein
VNIESLAGLQLRGGFRIADVEVTDEPLIDAIGREAVAQTTITGREFSLLIRGGLSDAELSVTLYHEILEAAAVACEDCPAALADFNEAEFERAAQKIHRELGAATSRNLDRMLAQYGFLEKENL